MRKMILAMGFLAAAGCSSAESDTGSDDQDFSSALATQLDFEFDGNLITDSTFNTRQQIQDQFLYTIGHLNTQKSVGRLDALQLTNIQSTRNEDGTWRVSYHAKLPVAWGSKANLPTNYKFILPKVINYSGLEAFTSKYKVTCVDSFAHDVDSGSMWYYYRPLRSGCTLDPADVVTLDATVTVSTSNTTGKYPEYQKVWEDNQLRVVAIFGKYEDGATSDGDSGISAFNAFTKRMKSELGLLGLSTQPDGVSNNPGVANPDVTFEAKLADGKTITVNALLVDNVSTATSTFYERYESLSTKADLIMYNGHAGLGQNVRALARKGRFEAGRYLLLFMNGCDTFAYVDGYLAQTRAVINPDDPSGTKYMDIVTNAMPAYFVSDAPASTSLIKAMINFSTPKTFEKIFTEIDSSQVVLVTGEEDNVFQPGMPIGTEGGGGGTPAWTGIHENGTVAKAEDKPFETPELPAGKYTFTMTGTSDADLYVKKGAAPTTTSYDCRPYTSTSNETCTITLDVPGKIFANVRGYATTSDFKLDAQ